VKRMRLLCIANIENGMVSDDARVTRRVKQLRLIALLSRSFATADRTTIAPSATSSVRPRRRLRHAPSRAPDLCTAALFGHAGWFLIVRDNSLLLEPSVRVSIR
jgi:hypothetical protein